MAIELFIVRRKRVLLFDNVYKAVYIGTSINLAIPFNATPNFDPALRKYEFTYEGDIGLGFYRQTLSTTKIAKNGINLGGSNNSYSFPTSEKHNVIIDKDKLYVDDVLISTLSIGNRLDTTNEQSFRITTNLEFYEMKIYDNDVLVYHFVPAYRKLTGISEQYGIAELVSETFVNDYRLNGEPEYEE